MINLINKNCIFEKNIYMIKAGVIGVGHLGSIHLKLLNESSYFELIGFHDNDLEKSKIFSNDFTFFKQSIKLIKSVDVIFICSNTPTHYSIAKTCLEHNKHIFIEKPITTTIEEAKELIETRNMAENMIHVTKKSLNDLGDKVEDKEKSDIETAISELEEVLKGDNKDAISEKTTQLTEVAGKLAERAYAEQQGSPDASTTSSDVGDDKNSTDNDAVDAEFEEI